MSKRLMCLMMLMLGLSLMPCGIVSAEEEFKVDISDKQVVLQAGGETFTVERFGKNRTIKAGVCTVEGRSHPLYPAFWVQRKAKIVVDEKPYRAGIDPYNKLIDRISDDNRVKVEFN